MNLLDCYLTDCEMLVLTYAEDDEGGRTSSYAAGEAFQAAITRQAYSAPNIANKPTYGETYIVITRKDKTLKYGDIFRRKSDNKTFRAVSSGEENFTPSMSAMDYRQIIAEGWDLP